MPTLAAALALAACMLAAPAPARAQSPMGAFCGLRRSHPSPYQHVLWIWMENHTFGQIVGSSDAPHINALIADCGLATNYRNITHVPLPNHIRTVTGLALPDLRKFDGDCSPSATRDTA